MTFNYRLLLKKTNTYKNIPNNNPSKHKNFVSYIISKQITVLQNNGQLHGPVFSSKLYKQRLWSKSNFKFPEPLKMITLKCS